MPNTIQSDISESKKQESVYVRVTDGKIVCSFTMVDNTKDYDQAGSYVNYEKVFNSWSEFNEYAQEFFKTSDTE